MDKLFAFFLFGLILRVPCGLALFYFTQDAIFLPKQLNVCNRKKFLVLIFYPLDTHILPTFFTYTQYGRNDLYDL